MPLGELLAEPESGSEMRSYRGSDRPARRTDQTDRPDDGGISQTVRRRENQSDGQTDCQTTRGTRWWTEEHRGGGSDAGDTIIISIIIQVIKTLNEFFSSM